MGPIKRLSAEQRKFFETGATRAVPFRKASLRKLMDMLSEHGDTIAAAIGKDLGRCWIEAWGSEPGLVLADIRYALPRLGWWNRRKSLKRSPMILPGRAFEVREPLGTAVIIGPWNYPAGLLLAPMVCALAAGNTVILKPSERAPHTAGVLADLIGRTFPENHVAVVQGGAETASELIREAADIVCFTGSCPTGRKVMALAASRPIPVILELGGANPCYVAHDAAIAEAAERIAWGKFFAAGQTCLAPNHVFVHEEVCDEFLDRIAEAVRKFYGERPETSPDYGRIIDKQAWERLQPMLDEGTPVCGGYSDRDELFVAPTVLRNVAPDSRLFSEEIFGPVLPVQPVNSMEEAMALCGTGDESPLAAYGFSRRTRHMRRLMEYRVRAASITVNGTLHRIVSSSIGFGGVGGSGFGRYRGLSGYRNFTWQKVFIEKNPVVEMPMVYPPYRIGRRLVRLLGRLF